MRKNIFTYEAPRGELVETFYNLLVTGEIVSYEKILAEYDGEDESVQKISAHPLYKTLKHVVPDVVEELRRNGFCVLTLPKGNRTYYKYVGSDKDPLKNIRFKALIEERFEILSECITHQNPVKISYKPFDKNKMELIFHPHLLYQFNGRSFVFGVSEKKGSPPFRKFVMALDRIEGDILNSNSTFIPAEPDEYDYLMHLVGVRFEQGSELIKIRLRAHDQYTFGRLATKPLHDSQKTLSAPDRKADRSTGDVEIEVYPNVELVGQILSYGNLLEVISPETFRDRVREELEKTLGHYEKTGK